MGNKRGEYKYFKDYIINDINKYNTIIEPFCGSSAISFNLWKDGHKDKVYILNDNDKDLIEIYNLIRTENPDDILFELNKILDRISNKEIFMCEYKRKDLNIYEKLFFKKYFALRPGLYPSRDNERFKNGFKFSKEQLLFFDFIKNGNIIITCGEWIEIFNKFKNDKDVLFIIDPPYINSCNEMYNLNMGYKENINIYEYMFNNNINDFKSKIIFILEDIWIIKILFKDNIKESYKKTYQMNNIMGGKGGKKKTNHLIISN